MLWQQPLCTACLLNTQANNLRDLLAFAWVAGCVGAIEMYSILLATMPMLAMLLVAIVCYALFGTFVAKAAGRADGYIANAIFNGLAAVIPFVIFLFMGRSKDATIITKQGVLYAVLAGLFLTIFSVLVVKVFARGGNLAYVLPVVYGGAIALASLLGWLVLKESIVPLQLFGIVLILAGVGCVVAAKL